MTARNDHAGWLRAHADVLDTIPALNDGAPGSGAIADQMRMAANYLDGCGICGEPLNEGDDEVHQVCGWREQASEPHDPAWRDH